MEYKEKNLSAGEGVYRKLGFNELCDLLCERRKTLIIFHAHPDGDAIGSAFALRQLLSAAGSPSICVCADELHRRYRFAAEGIQESVLPGALPSGFPGEGGRIITVDTASRAQMGSLYGLYGRDVDIMIDHHGRGEEYADNYIDPAAAATGEIIFDISRELLARGAVREIPAEVNLLCYIAIATDTGCFKYSNTTPDTHRRAAALMGSFDYADINFRLFDSKTADEIKVMKKALCNLRFFGGGTIAATTLTLEEKSELGVPDEYLDGLISIARSVDGVRVAAAIRQVGADEGVNVPPRNTYKASLRSNCDVDVAAVCAVFGGGGHKKAAGCTLFASDIEAAAGIIVGALGAGDI